jgi:hypothetical protein
MKANEIVSKLIAIKESKDFKWMDEKDILTVESEGSEYKLPVCEIDNIIKKLSQINEAKPYKPTGGNGIASSKRAKELQILYIEYSNQTTAERKHSLKQAKAFVKKKDPQYSSCYNQLQETLNRIYILELLLNSTNTKKPIKMEAKSNNGLRLIKYSDKAYALFGETKPLRNQLKEIGGKFNPYLKENGEKSPGWIFSAKKLDLLTELVNS